MDALANKPDTALNPINSQFKFGYYAELSNHLKTSDLKMRINKIINRLGFSDYSYNLMSNSTSHQIEFNTLPEELLKRYYNAGLYEQDMNLQRAKQDSRPFFHSTIYDYVARAPFKCDMTYCMQEIHCLNKEFGYYDFFSIPNKTVQGNDIGVLTVSRRGINPIDLKRSVSECESDLLLLSEAIDLVTTQLINDTFEPTEPKKNIINPKPLRVLNTLANNDLTINQIAEKLCISVVTANQHLKTARTSLGTHTNYAAIKQAVLKNLIQLDASKKYTPPSSS